MCQLGCSPEPLNGVASTLTNRDPAVIVYNSPSAAYLDPAGWRAPTAYTFTEMFSGFCDAVAVSDRRSESPQCCFPPSRIVSDIALPTSAARPLQKSGTAIIEPRIKAQASGLEPCGAGPNRSPPPMDCSCSAPREKPLLVHRKTQAK